MNTTHHTAESRGFVDHGWLKSFHTFSFGTYHDPNRMGFGKLRVINDDRVAPGHGFATHPHENMEIVSIPLAGSLKHKDSEGNQHQINAGEVQVMSAGTGILHSEFNGSNEHEVNFLQIWILPKQKDIKPRYEQKSFDIQTVNNQWTPLVSSEKNQSSAVWINQDVNLVWGHFDRNQQTQIPLATAQGCYFFLCEGKVQIGDATLKRRDGFAISAVEKIKITFLETSQLLAIHVPLK